MKVGSVEKTYKMITEFLSEKKKHKVRARKKLGVGKSLTNFLFKDLSRLKKENQILSSQLVFQTNTILKTQTLNQSQLKCKMEENVLIKKQIMEVRFIRQL
jgi:hypothetical protein